MDKQPIFRARVVVAACALLLAMAALVIASVHYGVKVHSGSPDRTLSDVTQMPDRTWSDIAPMPDIPVSTPFLQTSGGETTLLQGSHKGPTPLTKIQKYKLDRVVLQYNIPGGDLSDVLRQVLGVGLTTNAEWTSVVGQTEEIRHQLETDMDGLRGAPVVGRMTVIRAVEQALKGTPCQHEVFGDGSVVYVFCRSHLVFPVDYAPSDLAPNSNAKDTGP